MFQKNRIIFIFALFFFFFFTVIDERYRQHQTGFGKNDLAVFVVAGQSITGSVNMEPIELYTNRAKIKRAIAAVRPAAGGTHFLYLPQSALLFVPFVLLHFNAMAVVWLVCNSLFVMFAYYFSIAYFVRDQIMRIRYSLLLCILAFSDTVQGLMRTGQINGFIWLLLVGGCIVLLRKNNAVSGVLFGIAATLKVFPLIFFPYLLLKRYGKSSITMVLTCLALLLLSLPWFGFHGVSTFTYDILPNLLRGDVGYIRESTSLFGSFMKSIQLGYWDWLGVSRKTIIAVGKNIHPVLVVGVLVLVSAVLYRRRKMKNATTLLMDYSLLILFVLLFSKSIHSQYQLWVLPIILYLFHFPLTRKTIGVHLTALVTLVFTQYSQRLFTDNAVWWYIKPATLGMLILFIVALWYPRWRLLSENKAIQR
ncbi:MAG: DUF2029 domain-containing protein [Candidatus Kerfeldbacteria bacterium]|nr:DUF2029 domain-containing protein [Candidatus Kerfeldbacteria bacterium]